MQAFEFNTTVQDGVIRIPDVYSRKITSRIKVIVLIDENENSHPQPTNGIKFGCLKGKIAKVPDSFFEPLPEEELQLWGL